MILNLMPCVLPVIFAKDLRIYSASGSKPTENFAERHRVHAGIFAWFIALGAASDRAQKPPDATSPGAVFNSPILTSFSC